MICSAQYAGHLLKDISRPSTWRLVLWHFSCLCLFKSKRMDKGHFRYNSDKSLIKKAPLNLSNCLSIPLLRHISSSPDSFSVITYLSTRWLQTFLLFQILPLPSATAITSSPSPAPHFLIRLAAYMPLFPCQLSDRCSFFAAVSYLYLPVNPHVSVSLFVSSTGHYFTELSLSAFGSFSHCLTPTGTCCSRLM